ncbi:outer membrane lipoprotein carrier protein LolA [Marinimicrobium sp. ABcell2]|uniref:outer membrane lipoprotein carrier protein LolA n=1 Tax=Marinimicrobium sp. ABcell2 TaxID=3069751 RepID=UPI0027B48F24|nr:outer membrane lipoprotein carrier protein LolA [Marinimicrobium sp. ABcell2]MDQ2076968.1 outer membrane lipoprotein carrier protein LolA [Marinimicrobium sp. ABcell2]
MINRAPWLLLLLALAVPAAGESVFSYPVAENPERQRQLSTLAETMSATSRIEGRFTQTKHLQILEQPLVSRGRFSLDDEGRFSWEIHQPFPQAYHFRDGELIRSVDGEEERVAPADEPSLHGFFQFFSALLQLTEADLGVHFTRYFRHLDDEQWEMGLRPKDRRMRRVLDDMVVLGRGERIQAVTLKEPGGDRTELNFDYHREEAGTSGESP